MRSPVNSQQIKNGRTQFAPTVRRRLHRIVRNSLWLSLTHCATPPFPQKSRSARLFGCKLPLDGSLSLPTFADLYIAFSRELSFISDNLTAAASHRPTTSSFAACQNADRGKPCPYGMSSFASYRSQQPLAVSHSLCNSSFSAKITLGLPVRL